MPRPSLNTLVRSVLLSEARTYTAETFLSLALGSDPGPGGNENEARMRRGVVARLIADEGVPVASFSSLAGIIAQHGLFKPSPTASSEEWSGAVRAAWQDVLDTTGVAELVKDLVGILSPQTSKSSARARSSRSPVRSQAEVYEILRQHHRWLEMRGGRIADLTGVQMPGIDLSDVSLRQAILAGSNLAGANLKGSDLSGANLAGANLRNANLLRASLRGADLRGANLAGASLGKFHLLDLVTWSGPRYEDAVFVNAAYDATTVFPDGFDPVKRGMIRA